MDKKKLGVYIHIPFCVQKCSYCDFLSFACDAKIKDAYCRALMLEIDARSSMNTSNNEMHSKDMILSDEFIVDTVFFGGGTPSSIDAFHIVNIIKKLKSCFKFSESAEISIECNPGTLNFEKLLIYKKAGINRLSIGLQSTENLELKLLGRIHTFEEFAANYELAREAGFDNINIDLMSALPGQTRESYARTLKKVAELEPEHISAYSLMVEKNTPLYEMIYGSKDSDEKSDGAVKQPADIKAMLPDEDTEREMYYDTEYILGNAGYARYEISNYAKSGYECRHNVGYWTGKDYIGFGIGAASLILGTRYSNCRDIGNYIKNSGYPAEITENADKLTEYDQMEEFMFLGLRITDGINKLKFSDKFGVSYDDIYGEVSRELSEKGLLELNGDNVRLTGKGIDVSNYVLSYFLFE